MSILDKDGTLYIIAGCIFVSAIIPELTIQCVTIALIIVAIGIIQDIYEAKYND